MRSPWTAGRVIRLAVIGLVVLGFIPLLMISGSRLIGGSSNGTAQVATFAPVAGGCWLLALVLLLTLRAWWFAGFAGLLVALHLVWMAPPVVHRVTATGVTDGTTMRVLTVNAQYGGADVAQLARIVSKQQVDLVAFQEMTPEFEAAFTQAMATELPNHVAAEAPQEPSGGTGVWSRWPLQSQGVLSSAFRIPTMLVSVPGAGPVEVVAVHAQSPLPNLVPSWKADLAMLATKARADVEPGKPPLLMIGDFNATRDHAPFRSLIAGGSAPLFDAEEQTTLWPWRNQSWPADRRFVPPLIRIDHILLSKGDFSVSRLTTYAVDGTDHRAVQADLQVTGSGH